MEEQEGPRFSSSADCDVDLSNFTESGRNSLNSSAASNADAQAHGSRNIADDLADYAYADENGGGEDGDSDNDEFNDADDDVREISSGSGAGWQVLTDMTESELSE